jgi:hypothetical protein
MYTYRHCNESNPNVKLIAIPSKPLQSFIHINDGATRKNFFLMDSLLLKISLWMEGFKFTCLLFFVNFSLDFRARSVNKNFSIWNIHKDEEKQLAGIEKV